ncbi:MAG: ImmA/IrrE family metallo-endopeptidase [Phreatobacter sp.]
MARDALIRAITLEDIEIKAAEAAALLELEDEVPRDLIELSRGGFKKFDKNFEYRVVPDHAMPGQDGKSTYEPVGMVVPERTHRGLLKHDYRSRFTVAHELGHVMLHPYLELNRCAPDQLAEILSTPTRSAEWQANKFAAAFLMPKSVCKKAKTPEELQRSCVVSMEAATFRLEGLGLWRQPGIVTPRIQQNLDEIFRAAGWKPPRRN